MSKSVLFFYLSRGMNNVFLIISPQLDMYSKKFDEFQGTVSKSNSVYSSFKQDMDKVRLYRIFEVNLEILVTLFSFVHK